MVAEFKSQKSAISGECTEVPPVKVLLVEDSERDCILLYNQLVKGGLHIVYEKVETADEFCDALSRENWDLILADYTLPGFSGLSALRILKDRDLDLPFIIVSGSIDEEVAVAVMKAGAHDYILKDNTRRLVPAVKRELQEAAERRARRKAEVASLRKNQFLATMSHELRSPLSNIMTASSIALDEMLGPLTGEQKKYFSLIYKNAEHLLHIVNDILDISKIEAGKDILNIEQIELGVLIEESVMLIKPLTEQKRQELEIHSESLVPCFISGDRLRLKQAVSNLLSNAHKFTPSGKKIQVNCFQPDWSSVIISVSDEGPGIAEGELEHILRPFEQGNGPRLREGTGLGLPITKKIVELHGGRLTIETELGKGSVFSIYLPTM